LGTFNKTVNYIGSFTKHISDHSIHLDLLVEKTDETDKFYGNDRVKLNCIVRRQMIFESRETPESL